MVKITLTRLLLLHLCSISKDFVGAIVVGGLITGIAHRYDVDLTKSESLGAIEMLNLKYCDDYGMIAMVESYYVVYTQYVYPTFITPE